MDQNILNGAQIGPAILELINETEDYCFLAAAAFRPWDLLKQALKRAAEKEKRLVFILDLPGDGNLEPYEYLNKELGFDLIVIRNLHAKLYLNEKQVIIGSMDLEETAPEQNLEVGYALKGSKIASDFKTAIIDEEILGVDPYRVYEGRYLQSLKPGVTGKEPGQTGEYEKILGYKSNQGYCIRCRNEIKYYPFTPLCPECFDLWRENDITDYPGEYCHSCGNEHATTVNMPLCPKCYRKKNKRLR